MPALSGGRPAPLRRVGHKGADLIAPGNTVESFDVALAHGVDMIEFDVLPADPAGRGDDRLLLAHDYEDAAAREPLTLEEGLAHLAGVAFTGVELDVDLKLRGYEERVVRALEEAGLTGRSLISTQHAESLERLRELRPDLRLGWSVPRARRDYTSSRLYALPALGALEVMKRALPRRAAAAVRAGRCDALMAHWRLVTPGLVRAVRGAGGDVFVWTVDHAEHIRRFEAMGVTGVITNDPRLFGPAA
jgi:glycerophosphoryl diester phosphodiesterase